MLCSPVSGGFGSGVVSVRIAAVRREASRDSCVFASSLAVRLEISLEREGRLHVALNEYSSPFGFFLTLHLSSLSFLLFNTVSETLWLLLLHSPCGYFGTLHNSRCDSEF